MFIKIEYFGRHNESNKQYFKIIEVMSDYKVGKSIYCSDCPFWYTPDCYKYDCPTCKSKNIERENLL